MYLSSVDMSSLLTKDYISSVLTNLTSDAITDVFNHLRENVGAEVDEDLLHVVESDLLPVLRPVQARKLMAAWSNHTPVQVSDRIPSSAQVAVNKDRTWIHNFEIPWNKCSPRFLNDIINAKVPSAKEIRQLINHTMSDVFTYTRKPTRNDLRTIARKIVQKSPQSFADYINGCVFDDGTNSPMLMLESKKENLNRRVMQSNQKSAEHSQTDDERSSSAEMSMQKPIRPSKSNMTYGCKRWEMPPPMGETVESMDGTSLIYHTEHPVVAALSASEGFLPQLCNFSRKRVFCMAFVRI